MFLYQSLQNVSLDFRVVGMSAPAIETHLAAPNIGDIPGPEIDALGSDYPDTGTISESAPDGRNNTDDSIRDNSRFVSNAIEEADDNPVDSQTILKDDNSTTDKRDTVQHEQIDEALKTEPEQSAEQHEGDTNADTEAMARIGSNSQKATPRVTDFRLPDKGKHGSDEPGVDHVVDIVKQSRLTGKKAPSEGGEFPEFPMSRPLTETSVRDGTRMSYDIDLDTSRELRKQSRMDTERDSNKTPFSVTIERKPLHTAQTRSHSDYFSKTPTTTRYGHRSVSQYYADPNAKDNRFPSQMPRMRRPPKLVRLATVTMSPK